MTKKPKETTRSVPPAATVTGLYRVDGCGLFPLTEETPLTPEEMDEFPIVIDLEFDPACDLDNIIVDLIYDNGDPIPLPDLVRGQNIPCCVPYWFHWFTIPAGDLNNGNGSTTDPRAPGLHTIQIRTAREAAAGRDFSPANAGWISRVCTFAIDEEPDPGDAEDDFECFAPEDPGDTDDADD